MFFWELFAHRHWIVIHAFDKEIRLCARCFGIILGFAGLKIVTPLISSLHITFHIGFTVALIFALPSIIDWTTQRIGFRKSNNNLRLTTGFLEGIGIGVTTLVDTSLFMRLVILTVIGIAVICVGVLGHRLAQRHMKRVIARSLRS